MKMNKKKVLTASLAVSLVAILSFGTIAWFNATSEEVTNKFMIADSDGNNVPDFSVELFETQDGAEVTGQEYIDILPNAALDKNPTVRNTGDYDMYTRVVVTLSDAKAWIDASFKYDIVNSQSGARSQDAILDEMIDRNSNWKRYTDPVYNDTADTLTYVYYYEGAEGGVLEGVKGTTKSEDKTTEPLFTKVTIPYQLQMDDMNYGNDKGFTITLKAEAVQSENIIKDTTTIEHSKAYTAFKEANWPELGSYPQP